MNTWTLGSLFTGYGGLDMGVKAALGGECREVWCSDVAAGPVKLIDRSGRFPVNLGDVTLIDWDNVEPVHVFAGGSPCQDLSLAGSRKGMKPGTRSGLWEAMIRGVERLRPHLVVWENVNGALSAEAFSLMEPGTGCVGDRRNGPVLRALGRVLGDLANIGYDAWWSVVRASDVGAPHRRARLFVVAADADREPWHVRWLGAAGEAQGGRAFGDAQGCGGKGVRLLPTPTASQMGGRKSPAYNGSGSFYDIVQAGRRGLIPYIRGIARWEGVFREAPDPIDETGRLSTLFVEWMMGLPEGWVTDPGLGLSRAQQLTMLGNGVVPQQAERAVRVLAGMARSVEEAE
jgi:DNA (cytosine-5)-methyltransferase 1|nr:MAG TPA: Cytosine specific methyltransferase [Caudoviricetes sp.]